MFEFLNTYLFHWMQEKAVWIGGHTLSWDARCSGIYIGLGIGVLWHLLLDKKAKNLPPLYILLFSSLLFIPLFADVFTVRYGFRPPSNDLRFLTGLLFGQAFSVYIYPAFITLTVAAGCERAAIDSWHRFTVLLVIIAGAYLARFLDHIAVYYLLESLAVFGCLSLFAVIVFGALKCFGKGRGCMDKGIKINKGTAKALMALAGIAAIGFILSCASAQRQVKYTQKTAGFYGSGSWGNSDRDINGEVGHELSTYSLASQGNYTCSSGLETSWVEGGLLANNWKQSYMEPGRDGSKVKIIAGTLPPGLTMTHNEGRYFYEGIPTERGHWIVEIEVFPECEGKSYNSFTRQLRFHITGTGKVIK